MNIVHYTNIAINKASGLTYSVAGHVLAQSKIDNLYWFNCSSKKLQEWDDINEFNNIDDIPGCHIKDFPEPFNIPDIVIFHSFYSMKVFIITKYLKAHKIPYIIVPHGTLTQGAQSMKRYKKIPANLFLFNRFAKNAAAIQYLTNEECKLAGKNWNKKSIIVPNGIVKKIRHKELKREDNIKGVFIGRLDVFAKGVDLLLKACEENKEIMLKNNCTIDLYGPKIGDYRTINNIILEAKLDDIVFLKGAVYDKEKEAVLLECDFFVLTSRFEGHPMGLLEAISYGLPCLVTSGTNMAEEIHKADAGWVCETNSSSLAEAMKEAIIQREQFYYKGKNALTLANDYSWDRIAKKTHEEYANLLNK